MSLTTMSETQPNLAWQFESSNVDSVSSVVPTTSVGPPTYNSSGKYGTSIVFSNTPGAAPGTYYLKYTTGISLSTASGFTICAWLKPLSVGVSGNQTFLSIAGQNTYFIFQIDTTQTNIHFYGQNPYTVPNVINGSGFNVNVNTWYHASVVFSGTSIMTYYNGTLKDSLSLVVSPVTFNALGLGNRSAVNADSAANCEIDDLRVYNTALSAAQVQSICTQGGAPASGFRTMPQPNLAWQFESSNVDYVTGLSPSFQTTAGSLTFAPTYTTGKYNQAISLTNSLQSTAGAANCYVVYNNLPSISVDKGVTLACWVKPVSFTAGTHYVVGLGDSLSNVLYINLNTTTAATQNTFPANTSILYRTNTVSGTISAGNWYHVAFTYNSTQTVIYLNGVSSTPVSTGSTGVNFTGLKIGTMTNSINTGAGFNPFDGLVDDLRVYNTALSAAQVQSIYQAQGMPSRGVQVNTIGTTQTKLIGTPLFSQLSTTATSSVVGAFSLRAVNGTTAKAVQIKRASDNATQDFWADRLGNLLTVPVTGQSLANWLGSSTGNVVTFYSQYGSSSATQSTVANQLQVVASGTSWLPQFSSAGSSTIYPFTSLNLGAVNGSYSKAFWVYATSNASQFDNFLSTSTAVSGQGIHSFGWTFGSGSNIPNIYVGQNSYTQYNVSTFALNTWTHMAMTYSNPTQTLIVYKNGSQVYSNTAWTSSFNAGDGLLATGFQMGRGFGNPCNNQAYDILIFNSALSASDITTLYNARLY